MHVYSLGGIINNTQQVGTHTACPLFFLPLKNTLKNKKKRIQDIKFGKKDRNISTIVHYIARKVYFCTKINSLNQFINTNN